MPRILDLAVESEQLRRVDLELQRAGVHVDRSMHIERPGHLGLPSRLTDFRSQFIFDGHDPADLVPRVLQSVRDDLIEKLGSDLHLGAEFRTDTASSATTRRWSRGSRP